MADALNLTDNQRRVYEASLREHRRAGALAYKLVGGRLNDPPRRRTVDLPTEELRKRLEALRRNSRG